MVGLEGLVWRNSRELCRELEFLGDGCSTLQCSVVCCMYVCNLELEACSAIYPNGMILIGPMFPFTLPHALRNFTCEFKVAKAPRNGVSKLTASSRCQSDYEKSPTEALAFQLGGSL